MKENTLHRAGLSLIQVDYKLQILRLQFQDKGLVSMNEFMAQVHHIERSYHTILQDVLENLVEYRFENHDMKNTGKIDLKSLGLLLIRIHSQRTLITQHKAGRNFHNPDFDMGPTQHLERLAYRELLHLTRQWSWKSPMATWWKM